MKLFKNGVGRPSKETIRKRKIFCWSAIIAALLVVGIGVYGVLSMYATRLTTAAATTNHNNVIIVVGASQVGRMNDTVKEYTYNGKKYVKGSNLHFIYEGGSQFDYQVNSSKGWGKVTKFVNNKNKTYHIFFPMPGNGIAPKTISQITNNTTGNNKFVYDKAKAYNDVIASLKKNYKVQGYVVSVQPVLPKQATGSTTVYNTNTKADDANYRSNCKYYKFNSMMMGIVNSKFNTNLKYLPLFKQIVNVGSGGYNYCGTSRATTYTYNKIYGVTYNTKDGIHLNDETAKAYTKLMFDKAAIK